MYMYALIVIIVIRPERRQLAGGRGPTVAANIIIIMIINFAHAT